MKKVVIFSILILVFFAMIFSAISFSSAEEFPDNPECFPEYACGEWEPCLNGLQTRNCVDTTCGRRDIVERRFCKKSCIPQLVCDGWSSCTYTQKTEDILNGTIRFEGYHTRFCYDKNECVDSFTEEESCRESYDLEVKNLVECGQPFVAAIDPTTQRPVAKISQDSWNKDRLDITFTQGYAMYCPSCYNNVLDANEEDVDCGGACKECPVEGLVSYKLITMLALWIFFGVFGMLSAFEYFFDRKPSSAQGSSRRGQGQYFNS